MMLRKQKKIGGKQAAVISLTPLFDLRTGLALEKILGIFPKTRVSNPLSKVLRPIFEHKNIHKILGTNLAALTLAVGASSIPTSALGVIPAETVALGNTIEVEVQTNKTVAYPLEQPLGMSQGFNVFHPGVDIRAPLGSDIYPIAPGEVNLVSWGRFGYGHYVEITHESGRVSLYAHMGKVFVEEGDLVTTATTLGEVGMTGRTTGPHLHLEVIEEGRKMNPLKVISY